MSSPQRPRAASAAPRRSTRAGTKQPRGLEGVEALPDDQVAAAPPGAQCPPDTERPAGPRRLGRHQKVEPSAAAPEPPPRPEQRPRRAAGKATRVGGPRPAEPAAVADVPLPGDDEEEQEEEQEEEDREDAPEEPQPQQQPFDSFACQGKAVAHRGPQDRLDAEGGGDGGGGGEGGDAGGGAAGRPAKRARGAAAKKAPGGGAGPRTKAPSSKAGSGPSRDMELQLRAQGYMAVGGADEAGRGPLAGPVVAAVVVLPPEGGGGGGGEGSSAPWRPPPGLNDSKAISEEEREAIYEALTTDPRVKWAVSVIDHEEIDRINILQAALGAMRQSAVKLLQQHSAPAAAAAPAPAAALDFLLVDGNRMPKELPVPARTVVKGDATCSCIAAASCIAKVTRDRLMLQLDEQYPQYGFAQHKGYGVPAHMEAIRRHGPSAVHRRSFEPIKSMTGWSREAALLEYDKKQQQQGKLQQELQPEEQQEEQQQQGRTRGRPRASAGQRQDRQQLDNDARQPQRQQEEEEVQEEEEGAAVAGARAGTAGGRKRRGRPSKKAVAAMRQEAAAGEEAGEEEEKADEEAAKAGGSAHVEEDAEEEVEVEEKGRKRSRVKSNPGGVAARGRKAAAAGGAAAGSGTGAVPAGAPEQEAEAGGRSRTRPRRAGKGA